MNDLILTVMLMLDALIVAIGIKKKKNMWIFIVMYWIILVVKNVGNL